MGLHGVYMPIKITWDFNKPKDNMIFQLVFDFFHVFPWTITYPWKNHEKKQVLFPLIFGHGTLWVTHYILPDVFVREVTVRI